MKKPTKRPVSGLTFIETETIGGTDFVTSEGEKIGAVKKNIVVAISKKDEETSEWKVGDVVDLGEGAKGYEVPFGDKMVVCMPNGFIIAIDEK